MADTGMDIFAGAVLIGMGGNFLAIMEYRTSWWLTVVRILYFAPFYAMGIFIKRYWRNMWTGFHL